MSALPQGQISAAYLREPWAASQLLWGVLLHQTHGRHGVVFGEMTRILAVLLMIEGMESSVRLVAGLTVLVWYSCSGA